MRFKKMIASCKKNKVLSLSHIENSATQYISDGQSIYPIPAYLSNLTEGSICSMFDISESVQEKMNFPDIPIHNVFMDDKYPNESECSPTDIRIIVDGEVMQPFYTELGCVFVKQTYIDIVGKDMKQLKFYLRDEKYLAIKSGLLLDGVVLIGYKFNKTDIKELNLLSTVSQVHCISDK